MRPRESDGMNVTIPTGTGLLAWRALPKKMESKADLDIYCRLRSMMDC